MSSKRFTASWLDHVQAPDSGRDEYFDSKRLGEGRWLGLRVSPRGKSFFVMYRVNGRLKRLTLGRYDKRIFGLADAREKADEEVAKILGGRDPAAEKRARREAITFGELADAYLSKYAVKKKDGGARDREYIEREFRPVWSDWKAIEVTRTDARELLEAIEARGPVARDRALACGRKLYNWAIEQDKYSIENNPFFRIKLVAGNAARDRVLSADEIRKLWSRLGQTKMTTPVQIALKLMLATAQRKGEVVTIEKRHIDRKTGWWSIPKELTKNRLAHHVPLAPLALELIAEAWTLSGDSQYLFPSPRGDKAILATAVDSAVRRKHNARAIGIKHWTPHDLRRTAATQMASGRVSRDIIGKILNHKERGVTSVYDRHSYDVEKREALEKWEEQLLAILEERPSKVVPMRRG